MDHLKTNRFGSDISWRFGEPSKFLEKYQMAIVFTTGIEMKPDSASRRGHDAAGLCTAAARIARLAPNGSK